MPRDVLILCILLIVSSASFGLGLRAGLDVGQGTDSTSSLQGNASIDESPSVTSETAATSIGQIVASKNGTKYYLPGCAGADRISLANKVWFASVAAAVAAGYAPAANCKGM